VREDGTPDESLSDPVVELSVAVTFEQPQQLGDFWGPLLKLPARAAANLRCIGRSQGRWSEIQGQDDQAYDEVHLLLQLADRQGAVTEAELVPFVQAVEAAAAKASGTVAVPPVPQVLEHARSLDQFCADVDVQMAVHVVNRTGGEFVGSKLRGVMEAAGMKLKPDGLFHLPDDWGKTIVTLSNFGAAPFAVDQLKTLKTHGVTFWLDVPRVPNGPQAFDRLVNIAKALAEAVDGVLVDDQRRPLNETVLASIRGKIGELQRAMTANEIPPGGRRALRLFR
jgi:FtsZ-interacting cell division protein ZipA